MGKKAKNFMRDFKEFAVRGNVIDLAVGVIIGGAFGKITSSLVNNVVMPIFGLVLGGVHFQNLSFTLKEAVVDVNGAILKPALQVEYGLFIQSIVDFVIIAFAIYCMITMLSKLKRKQVVEEAEETNPPVTAEQLLTEIRDLLKENN